MKLPIMCVKAVLKNNSCRAAATDWRCPDGNKHFICAGCGQEKVSNGEMIIHDPVPGEEMVSVCDDCAIIIDSQCTKN